MDINYLGHSSFKLKGKNLTIVTDPFDPEMVGIPFPKVSSDVVTISHQHQDHNFGKQVVDVRKTIDAPGEYEIAGVSIVGISTFHDSKKGELRGKNTIFIFEIDGLRVVHLGDLGHKLSEEMLNEIGTVDVLMIPCGGEYTIGPEEASEVVREIEPVIVVPMHFFVDGLKKETFGSLKPVDDFLREVGLNVEKVDKLSLKKELLQEERKVVVLERKS